MARSATKKACARASLKNQTLRYAPDHRRAFERNAPPVHVHVLRETHGLEHLGTEHAAVSHLDPLDQHRVKREDLEGRLQEAKRTKKIVVNDEDQDQRSLDNKADSPLYTGCMQA